MSHKILRFLLFLNVVAAKKTRKSSSTEVDVQAIVNAPTREDKRCDIDYHFREPVLRLVNGKMKKCCSCKLCPYVFFFHLGFFFLSFVY